MRGGLAALCLLASGCDIVFGLSGDGPPLDGRDPDADPIAACSTLDSIGYDIELASAAGHRFRITDDTGNFKNMSAACGGDLVGATHIFTLSETPQLEEMRDVLAARSLSGVVFFYGAVQPPSARTLVDGWRLVTSASFNPVVWTGTEPDDNQFTEDGEENVAAFSDMYGGVIDFTSTAVLAAICECDGREVDEGAQAIIDDLL